MDVFEHIVDKVIVVLDGVVASSSRPHGAFPFDDELPHYSLCMPGRVLSQDVLFGMNEGIHCLISAWIFLRTAVWRRLTIDSFLVYMKPMPPLVAK